MTQQVFKSEASVPDNQPSPPFLQL